MVAYQTLWHWPCDGCLSNTVTLTLWWLPIKHCDIDLVMIAYRSLWHWPCNDCLSITVTLTLWWLPINHCDIDLVMIAYQTLWHWPCDDYLSITVTLTLWWLPIDHCDIDLVIHRRHWHTCVLISDVLNAGSLLLCINQLNGFTAIMQNLTQETLSKWVFYKLYQL